jgi:hypothetical protein
MFQLVVVVVAKMALEVGLLHVVSLHDVEEVDQLQLVLVEDKMPQEHLETILKVKWMISPLS